MQRHAGFTLIEVLVTVAIIAILAAIALPNYAAYVQRGKITEATANLLSMRTKMEQYYQDTRSYVGACAAGTVAPLPPLTAQKYFAISCAPAPGVATYTIRADGQADLTGLTFTIDQSNVRKTLSVPPGWTAPTGNCWLTRKSGDC